MNALEKELHELFGFRFERSRPLADLTSFRIGGPADYFIEVENDEELSDALRAAHRNGVSVFSLGAGTNLLISDRGIRGLVVKLGRSFSAINIEDTKVIAGAAAQFRTLVEAVVDRSLKGLEFGEGIPGTVGGGLVMNAGAFGGEMARVVRTVHGIAVDGQPRELSNAEVGFTYRRTALPTGFIITRVDCELEYGDRQVLWDHVMEIRAKRESRQPKGVPNAGSIFKNPAGHFAGRLLEGAGLKGKQVGAAAFSCRHANFIVNLGGAQASDVRSLIEMARNKVMESAGVALEAEVRMVGDW